MLATVLADTKTCTKCGECLPRTREFFHLHPRSPDGLKPRCKTCRCAEQKASYPAVRAVMIERATAWNRQNIGRHVAANRRYRQNNPQKARAFDAVRHAREAAAFIEPVDHLKVFDRDGWICGICDKPVTLSLASLDHVIPLSKGGEHSYANTQCSHRSCNFRKRDRMPT